MFPQQVDERVPLAILKDIFSNKRNQILEAASLIPEHLEVFR